MSTLRRLIAELCPEGVEWKTLGEICDYIRGVTYNKSNESKNGKGYRLLRANNITLSTNTVNFDDIKIIEDSVKIKAAQWLKENDILICAGSGSREHIGKVAFINNDIDFTFGGFMGVLRVKSILDSRFLFHVLTGSIFSKHLDMSLDTSTINNLNSTIMNGLRIPLPPLPIQQEIVRILDTFTALIEALTAELTARKKQYAYYRDKLLTFGDEVERVKLSDVVEMSAGGDLPRNFAKGQKWPSEQYPYPIYSNGTGESALYGFTDSYKIEKEAVTISARGTIGYHAVREGKFTPIVRLITMIADNKKIETKFLHYVLFVVGIEGVSTGIPSLTVPMLEKIQIPLPPLAEQQRIVAILDRFDTLVHDLTNGLPAEIEARRKQYAYYRDKLLTFPEASG